MPEQDQKARQPFRTLAAVTAVACFIIAGVFGWVQMEGHLCIAAVCIFLGVVMSAIATTGSLPRNRRASTRR
jgi:hypothetical protein